MIVADMKKLELDSSQINSYIVDSSTCNCGFCRACAIVNQQIELDLSDFYS